MAHYWLKLYTDILDDPKMGTLPDNLWRRTVELFLIAKRYNDGGTLPPVDEMAWTLRTSPEALTTELHDLAECTTDNGKPGIVHLNDDGAWYVTNFAKRQAKTPAAERMRRLRERERRNQTGDSHERNGNEPDTPETRDCYAPVTPRNTDQIRSEQIRSEDKEGAQAPALEPPKQEPEPKPKPKRARKKPNPPPPAVARFRKATNRYPNKALYKGIAEVVGDDPDNLDRWERTCRAYVAMGWNPQNVKGMLQHYAENRIPGDDRKGGARASPVVEPAGFAGLRELMGEEAMNGT